MMTPDELAELRRAHVRLSQGHEDMKNDLVRIRLELTENTKVTTEVRDILTTARGALKFLGGVGMVTKWVAGVLAAIGVIYSFFHFPKL